MKDTQDQYTDRSGLEKVAENVIALEALLVDYGEATIKTDVKEWHREKRRKG